MLRVSLAGPCEGGGGEGERRGGRGEGGAGGQFM